MGSSSGLSSPQPDIAGKPQARQTTIFHAVHEKYSLAARGGGLRDWRRELEAGI
jgi:hypothetical protein